MNRIPALDTSNHEPQALVLLTDTEELCEETNLYLFAARVARNRVIVSWLYTYDSENDTYRGHIARCKATASYNGFDLYVPDLRPDGELYLSCDLAGTSSLYPSHGVARPLYPQEPSRFDIKFTGDSCDIKAYARR